MDKEQPFNVLDDSYSLYVPIEKSIHIDENGDYVVQGVMTSDANDEEDDSISPEGMDCSYFLEKGWIKYEHGNRPDQFIGEPMEVKVGRFDHPTLMKSVNGIHVKGRLFSSRDLTKQAVKAIEDLQKSNTKRTMGWSIEGNVKERCKKTGKIIKSVLRNVVLTMNPVNTTTWAELAKSFAKNHELTIDMPDMNKAMDIAGAQAITPQSIEGYNPKKDPQDEWVKLFRSFVKQELMKKSFVTSDSEDLEIEALHYALSKGLDYEEAEDFASYIAEKLPILKSVQIQLGGASMGEQAKNTLSSLLDTDLDELQKSLAMDEEDEDQDFEDEDQDEELNKSMGDNEDEDAGDDSEDEEDEEDEDSEDEEDEDEEVEKSLGQTELTKSLSEAGHSQAFEVSDFLTSLTDEIGFSLEGLEKSLTNVTKQNTAIVKSLSTFGSVMQKALETIEAQAGQIDTLEKSLGEVLNRPVGRKGVVSGKEVQTLQKSIDTGNKRPLNRNQVSDILVKSFEAGEIPGSTVSRFEAGTPLDRLGLPESIKQQLNL